MIKTILCPPDLCLISGDVIGSSEFNSHQTCQKPVKNLYKTYAGLPRLDSQDCNTLPAIFIFTTYIVQIGVSRYLSFKVIRIYTCLNILLLFCISIYWFYNPLPFPKRILFLLPEKIIENEISMLWAFFTDNVLDNTCLRAYNVENPEHFYDIQCTVHMLPLRQCTLFFIILALRAKLSVDSVSPKHLKHEVHWKEKSAC